MTEVIGFFARSLADPESSLVHPGSPLGANCNGVKQKGCQGAGLESSVSGHHKDNDRLYSPQERAWTEQDPVTPTGHPTHPAREVHGSGLSSRDGQALGSHLMLHVSNPNTFIFSKLSALWAADLISLFIISFYFANNKSQPVTGNPLPPASVSPTLFQWHPPLHRNLSVSKFTNNFNAWLVLQWREKKVARGYTFCLQEFLHLLIGLAGCDAQPLQISNYGFAKILNWVKGKSNTTALGNYSNHPIVWLPQSLFQASWFLSKARFSSLF